MVTLLGNDWPCNLYCQSDPSHVLTATVPDIHPHITSPVPTFFDSFVSKLLPSSQHLGHLQHVSVAMLCDLTLLAVIYPLMPSRHGESRAVGKHLRVQGHLVAWLAGVWLFCSA